ncbi:hypothetical protein [Paraburkholderia sp. C35]|uniref:hypothetical protein n=1 Tax=Paraburkholderia sp. C35 TaxID=2126993 RepID=UPI000D697785|nr:hypothetical protein [Paraburkholderia sp. C35]
MDKHDDDVVRHYVDELMALGVRIMSGEQVSENIRRVVDTAFIDFEVRFTTTPEASKLLFLSRLKLNAGLVASSSPGQSSVLMKAHDIGMKKLFV